MATAATGVILPREADVRDAMTCHEERQSSIAVAPEVLFDHLDDPAQFGRHMAKPSLMMLGGSMSYVLDSAGGRAVGSRITMTGSVMGFKLAVDEVVVVHAPPREKVWETVGSPQLIVLRAYRMGFRITHELLGSNLVSFIDYVPSNGFGWLARIYARWCVDSIITDAETSFSSKKAQHPDDRTA